MILITTSNEYVNFLKAKFKYYNMIKFSTSLLAVFLLILLGGESYANEELGRSVEELRESREQYRLAQEALEKAQEEEREQAQEEVRQREGELQRAEEQIDEKFADVSEDELRSFFVEIPDLSASEKVEIQRAIAGKEQCGDSWWSFVCRITSDDPTEGLYKERYGSQIEPIINSNEDFEIKNSQINGIMNEEIQSLQGFESFSSCNSPNSNCREAIRNHCSSTNCGENENSALEIHQAAADNYLIPKSGMMRAAEFLDVSPGAFAAADMVQDLLGFEFSLVKEGSGIDKILNYGTPEQVCYAKVDSFIDVSGAQVEGQEIEVEDEVTGMTSKIKACDNKNFDICADLRAERTDMYFNNSFTLIVHFYVYNVKDYEQEVVLNAEFFDEAGNKDAFNVFNKSNREITNGSIILESGQRESLSLEITNLQVFNGEDVEELYGNVLLSVFRKEDFNEDEFVSDNFEYAIDYPIMKMSGGEFVSRDDKDEQVENSGVEAVDGTTAGTSSLIDRVNLS